MPLSATVARVVSAEDPTIPINDSKEINGEQGISPEVESDFPDGGLRAWLIVFGVSAKAPLHLSYSHESLLQTMCSTCAT